VIYLFIIIKKLKLLIIAFILILSAFMMITSTPAAAAVANNNPEVTDAVNQIFTSRSKAMLGQDIEYIDSLYDKSTKFGLWAFEHEEKKMKYIHNWSQKQGIELVDIKPTVAVKRIRGGKSTYNVNLICSTEYKYRYENSPDEINTFRIGTYHSLQINNDEGNWLITKEWYTDPFADSLRLDNLKVDAIKEYITAQSARDFSSLNKRRVDAVSYADKYSGAANEEKYGFTYNKKYKDFNPMGGDCANFASQILHEGGKFRKTGAWNFDGNSGTRAWLNAQGFKDYMVGSGRASVIAQGNYEKVYKASYKLLPGDFVAYEKKGKITHISVVTGADSKGYSLVNCHNTDRHRVPWDLGWSNKNIKFYLVRVHF
jgi:hypothetical protein